MNDEAVESQEIVESEIVEPLTVTVKQKSVGKGSMYTLQM